MSTSSEFCCDALKEWSVACQALQHGRQIFLIRKGGLLDAEGVFAPEYSRFWLWPTKWHQDANLLKPAHHDLLQNDAPPSRDNITLSSWAKVEAIWSLDARENPTREKLQTLDCIWSAHYLDLRMSYLPEKPLVVMALRVFNLETPHQIPSRPEYFGCKSWVELNGDIATQPAHPALDESAFERQLKTAREVLN